MIIGASFDTVAAQRQFAESQEFPYALISDASREIGRAYGVEQEAKNTPRRISYLIDPDGIITRVYDLAGQDLSAHASQVLADIAAADA